MRGLLNGAGRPWREGEVVAGVSYVPKGGEKVEQATAPLTLVCDGMFSTLRKRMMDAEIHKPSFFVGVILEDCPLPCPNHGHVVLADPSPILFYPISSTEVRCLVDIKGDRLPSAGNGDLAKYMQEVVGPQLPRTLQGPFLAAVEKGRFRSMQNKAMAAKPVCHAGAVMLGDSYNMRHPITGGGMTVALHDTQLLCEMLHPLPNFDDPLATASQTTSFFKARKPWAGTINTLANALYLVFCRNGQRWGDVMQEACFQYLKKGGWYAAGPVSLLSGLAPKPYVLVTHFIMVALYGVGSLLAPFPTPGSVLLGLQLLWGALGIILPIVRAEGIRAVFFPSLVADPRVPGRGRAAALAGPAAGVALAVALAVLAQHWVQSPPAEAA